MSHSSLRVKKVLPEAILPTRAHADDAGLDLYAFEDGVIEAGGGLTARTGIAIALPPSTVGMVADPADGVPDLYFELRRNGQPINPRRGIPALDGKGQG